MHRGHFKELLLCEVSYTVHQKLRNSVAVLEKDALRRLQRKRAQTTKFMHDKHGSDQYLNDLFGFCKRKDRDLHVVNMMMNNNGWQRCKTTQQLAENWFEKKKKLLLLIVSDDGLEGPTEFGTIATLVSRGLCR